MPLSPEEQKKFLDSIEVDWADLIPEILPLLTATAEEAATEQLLGLGITEASDASMWTKVLDEAQQYASTRSAELVGKKILKDGTIIDNPNASWSISETTREHLRSLGEQTIENGWTVNQTQSKIIQDEAFSPARALNISRTERAFARGRGTHIASKNAGMKYKDWLLGEEACEICQANAAQGRIPIDEEFASGDDCVPAHPSCRCANGYYEDNEEEEVDAED